MSDWHGAESPNRKDLPIIDYGRHFRVGKVIRRSFTTLARNFFPFFAISFCFFLLLFILIFGVAWFGMADAMIDEGQFEPSGKFFISIIVIAVSFIVTYTLITGTIVYRTVQDLMGLRPPIGDCVALAWDRILPIIGVTLLSGLLFAFGFVALIIPGIILFCMFGLALPVAVVEQSGVLESFRTSAALTKGNRWRLFAVFLLIGVIEMVIGFIVGMPLDIISETSGSTILVLLTNFIQFVMQVIFYALNAVVLGVVYHDLRLVREREAAAGIAPAR